MPRVTLSGQRVRFRFYMSGDGQACYAAPAGVYATLTPVGDRTIAVTNGTYHWSSLGLSYGDTFYRDDNGVHLGSDQQALLAKYDNR